MTTPRGLALRDRRAAVLLGIAAATTALVLVAILVFLTLEALPALPRVGFASADGWRPTRGSFDLSAMAVGSVLVTLGALALGAPVGLGTALFCRFYAPAPLAALCRRVVGVAAGIPSVVYGLWGLGVVVPAIAQLSPPGPSLLAASIVLGLMIVPTLALLADAVFADAKETHATSAAALGLSGWATVQAILPAIRSGLLTAVILAAGRAIGETMVVLMVAGNVVGIPDSIFSPLRTLTANIALEMGYAQGAHRAALFASGLVLTLCVASLVVLSHRVSQERRAHGDKLAIDPPDSSSKGFARGRLRRGHTAG